ncbi:L,D-transpeptidase [Labrys monachus]|uniref:Lipoprotein-anchoring transpeptidase ErfK/SrfK n=1 Tax=Labrys monachus TaxID=217067 RepID=A0ABU0FNZ2_9HYPH|nr:L,D-transpeptidase [Labrys monachus]MDQ0395819.1 lipoprotein-anchoring transpeptidase ErfK/SrfK [Labrys monachus]
MCSFHSASSFRSGCARLAHAFTLRWTMLLLALCAGVLLQAAPAAADVIAKVDVASQSMTVIVDGAVQAVWSVSTARNGYYTPRGVYRAQALQRMHYSKKYHNSPMPFSVFFKGGYAVHGTSYVRQLGKAASHGCVRLAPQNAAALYQLIRQHGIAEARIIIS